MPAQAFRVTHSNVYQFDVAASIGECRALLRPADTARQICRSSQLVIVPLPTTRWESLDDCGNYGLSFTHRSRVGRLEVRCASTVELLSCERVDAQGGHVAWERAAAFQATAAHPQEFDSIDYRDVSPLVETLPAFREFASGCFVPGASVADVVERLMRRLRSHMRYQASVTDVGTTALEALELGAGVCQDYAHVAIACLRSMGLAARYVGGYVLRDEALAARDAHLPHAWASVQVPALGWIDFDPTLNRFCDDGYITVALGRDYTDVSPLSGNIDDGVLRLASVIVDIRPATLDFDRALATE